MQAAVVYRKRDKALFYWKTLITKFINHWFEVKRPRFRTFIYGISYTSHFLLTGSSYFRSPANVDFVETKFGKFRIRPRTVDMACVSPSYERRDMDYLLDLVSAAIGAGKKVLFLDIGANIGTFSIAVGNVSKRSPNVRIFSFEAAASNYALLDENISLNLLLEKIIPFNVALYSEDDRELNFLFNLRAPGEAGLNSQGNEKIRTRTLDSLLAGSVEQFDALIFKMDVEGTETEVLKGASSILGLGKESYFMVEDMGNTEVINYLENMGAVFICKLTPYNSWWRYSGEDQPLR